MIFCKDCFWNTRDKVRLFCASPNNVDYDPVSGDRVVRFTRRELRAQAAECGPEGTWFTPRKRGGNAL